MNASLVSEAASDRKMWWRVAREAWARDAASRMTPVYASAFVRLVALFNDDGFVDGLPSELCRQIGWRLGVTSFFRYLQWHGLIVRRGRLRIWAAPLAPAKFIHSEKEAKIVGEQRERIFARDGRSCRACGGSKRLCIDHVVAWSAGGTNDDDNLQVLCGSCNSRKQDRTQEHFEALCRKAGIELRGAA